MLFFKRFDLLSSAFQTNVLGSNMVLNIYIEKLFMMEKNHAHIFIAFELLSLWTYIWMFHMQTFTNLKYNLSIYNTT